MHNWIIAYLPNCLILYIQNWTIARLSNCNIAKLNNLYYCKTAWFSFLQNNIICLCVYLHIWMIAILPDFAFILAYLHTYLLTCICITSQRHRWKFPPLYILYTNPLFYISRQPPKSRSPIHKDMLNVHHKVAWV